jgi:hypothetical protein
VPPPSQPKFALIAPASYAETDVNAALDAVKQLADRIKDPPGLDKEALRQLRNKFYVNFFRLAEVTTQSANAGAAKDEVAALMTEAASDDKKIAEVGKVGLKWLGMTNQGEHRGILIAGTAEEIKQTPSGHAIALRVDPAQPPITVITPSAPGVAEGSRVVLTGSIIEKPSENIAGYGGDDSPVIWLGQLEKLPDASG